MPSGRTLRLLLGLVALAALVRLWRIGHQSYWLDESFSANAVRGDLGGMLHAVRHTESTPPLYYALAWTWERVFGWHEAGLRSLSALLGTATVPVAYAAARERFGERAGLTAAALFAVNPYLVWYSQEARAYALLVLLCAASLLYFLRGDARRWAIASALALLSHYFALFLVLPEAGWLLWRRRSRATALAVAVPAATAAVLVPLAIAQRNAGHTLFISDIPLGERLTSLAKKIATGELGTPTPVIGAAVGAALAAGALLSSRRGGALLLGLAGANVALALAVDLAGLHYFFPRNLIEAFVPLLVAVAGGLAAVRAGPLATAALAVAGLALVIQVSLDASLQRDDWRGAAHALGRARGPRAIVVTPEVGKTPLRLYAGPLPRLRPAGTAVAEIDLVANARRPRFRPPRPPPGFRLLLARRTETWQVVRFVAAGSRLVGPHLLAPLRLERGKQAALLVQRPQHRGPRPTMGMP